MTSPYVFRRFELVVPAPRFTHSPTHESPRNPSRALFEYPWKITPLTSPAALHHGPRAVPGRITARSSTVECAPMYTGPITTAPGRTAAPSAITPGPCSVSKTTDG